MSVRLSCCISWMLRPRASEVSWGLVRLAPQHKRDMSKRRAQADFSVQMTWWAFARVGRRTVSEGWLRMVSVEPMPSCPIALSPQHLMSPVFKTAQVVLSPAETSTAKSGDP